MKSAREVELFIQKITNHDIRQKPGCIIGIEQMNQTREMTRFYLSQLKAADPYEIHVINNKKIILPYYLGDFYGHLTVSQNWLVMYLCKGIAERISWGKKFYN